MLHYPIRLSLLYPAVLLSGATGLLYEIVWTRRLAVVLGSTTGAVSAVLSAFMLGLALGAVLVGRRADSSRRPLRWYGLLEVGIGVYALGFDGLLDVVGERLGTQPWLASFALLLLPTALMGGTLPVLARAAAESARGGARALGWLYGVNTLGAVLGALGTTLVLLEPLGLAGTTRLGAGINVALGALFWFLGTRAGDRPPLPEPALPAPGAAPVPGRVRAAVIAAFFASGLAGLALQVAWTRVLVYALEGFTLAFGLMLSAYLLGLGGGALAGTPLALATRSPRRLLSRLLLVQGLLSLATLPLVEPVGIRLEELRRGYAAAGGLDFAYGGSLFLATAVIVLPATLVAGMLLPAVARAAVVDRDAVGRQSGVVYAASTLGAVVAPPLAAFVLLPWLGAPGTIAAMAGLLVAAGALLGIGRRPAAWGPAAVAAPVFALLVVVAGVGRPLILRSHVFTHAPHPRRLIEARTGSLADVSVVEELPHGVRRLYLDGFSAAETARHYAYMRLLGHLPVLLHPEPRRVCVIAFGTGTTAGAVARHPEVEAIDCVEIEEEVYAVAHHFAEANRSVLDDPRAVPVVADGREFVARDGAPFDVVTLEPLMPYTPAAIYLYTEDFYRAARGRLAPGGLICQWIPPQGVSERDLVRLAGSMRAVFPWVSLWYFEHAVLVLGGERPPALDPARFAARCRRPEVAADLELARVGEGHHLLSMHVCRFDELDTAHAGAPPFTDDRTDLEFRPLPRRFGRRSQTFHADNLALMRRSYRADPPWQEGFGEALGPARAATGAALASLALELRRRVEGGLVVPAADLAPALRADPGALFARSVYERRRYLELVGEGRFEEAAALRYAPDRSAAFLGLARRAGGERRRAWLVRALRENALLEPLPSLDERIRLLREVARDAPEEERRWCENRARILAGDEPEPGPERPPAVVVGSVREALAEGALDEARRRLAAAHDAGLGDDAEEQAWRWWEESSDPRRDFAALEAIGSRRALRAALRLFQRGAPDDLVAVAGFFAARHPAAPQWRRLAHHEDPRVRAAAAAAAARTGSRPHLPVLAHLCADGSEPVRVAAWLSFRALHPDAGASGYDPQAPTATALEALRLLAG